MIRLLYSSEACEFLASNTFFGFCNKARGKKKKKKKKQVKK